MIVTVLLTVGFLALVVLVLRQRVALRNLRIDVDALSATATQAFERSMSPVASDRDHSRFMVSAGHPAPEGLCALVAGQFTLFVLARDEPTCRELVEHVQERPSASGIRFHPIIADAAWDDDRESDEMDPEAFGVPLPAVIAVDDACVVQGHAHVHTSVDLQRFVDDGRMMGLIPDGVAPQSSPSSLGRGGTGT